MKSVTLVFLLILASFVIISFTDARNRYGHGGRGRGGKRPTTKHLNKIQKRAVLEDVDFDPFKSASDDKKIEMAQQISIAKWSLMQKYADLNGDYDFLNVSDFKAIHIQGYIYKFTLLASDKSEVRTF